MADGTFKVGVFDDSRGGAPIPQEYVGKVVWYNDIQRKFLITDEDNHILKEFQFGQFRKFYDGNVLSYTNAGIKAHMESEMLQYEKQQQDDDPFKDADFYEQQGYEYQNNGYESAAGYGNDGYQPVSNGGEYEYNTAVVGRRAGNRRDAMNTGENTVDESGRKMKDPTKHIGAYFVVTFVIAIIAFILLNFAEPIIMAVAPLLN